MLLPTLLLISACFANIVEASNGGVNSHHVIRSFIVRIQFNNAVSEELLRGLTVAQKSTAGLGKLVRKILRTIPKLETRLHQEMMKGKHEEGGTTTAPSSLPPIMMTDAFIAVQNDRFHLFKSNVYLRTIRKLLSKSKRCLLKRLDRRCKNIASRVMLIKIKLAFVYTELHEAFVNTNKSAHEFGEIHLPNNTKFAADFRLPLEKAALHLYVAFKWALFTQKGVYNLHDLLAYIGYMTSNMSNISSIISDVDLLPTE